MRTFKLITKGVLLYVTILVTLLYMMGIDSISWSYTCINTYWSVL